MGTAEAAQQKFTEPFGTALRKFRKDRGLRQIELAVEVPVDHSLVSRWETGSALPTAKDLQRITSVLSLARDEAEELRYAWRRDNGHLLPGEGEAPVLRGAGDWIESLHVSIDCVRALRKAGQPRMALTLSLRDATLAFDRLRAQQWTDGHGQALADLSELFLEVCKASLDYVPGDAVRAGELDQTLRLQRLAAQSAASERALVFLALAREGTSYVAGNIGEAHKISLSLLDRSDAIPVEWIPEVVRACGINAGKLGDRTALEHTEAKAESLLRTMDGIPGGTRAFILEGLARGWSTVDAGHAQKAVEQAWAFRNESVDSEGNSSLRYVQLVRSQAEVELAARSAENLHDTLAKIGQALSISIREGFDKYVQELSRLGDRLS